MRFAAPTAAVLLALASAGLPAAAEEMQVERGGELARQLCSECHVVDSAAGGSDAVPTLHTIANTEGMTPERIRGFIYAPHPQMPSLQLPRDEVDAIVAYIRSLEE
jgi:mono/diheme cytochrome c family protein